MHWRAHSAPWQQDVHYKNGIRDACSTADCCPVLSIVVIHCGYQRLPLDGAVIGTFWKLLRMFWLNHSCVLRQFFGQINHCRCFSMFSIQSTTVSQCPAKVFSESNILYAPILNLKSQLDRSQSFFNFKLARLMNIDRVSWKTEPADPPALSVPTTTSHFQIPPKYGSIPRGPDLTWFVFRLSFA